jgi:hypothetical protein
MTAETVASAGFLSASRPDGILANTTASAVCITSDLPVMRPGPVLSGVRAHSAIVA